MIVNYQADPITDHNLDAIHPHPTREIGEVDGFLPGVVSFHCNAKESTRKRFKHTSNNLMFLVGL